MKLKKWFVKKFHFYVVFSKAILFILGLIFSYRLVDFAVFSVLITHLAAEWKHPNLPKSVIVVNLHEGTYAILQIFFAFLADAYTGLFNMVFCSTTFYIIGLSLFNVATRVKKNFNLSIFYSALVLVTFSQAALKVTLEAFLGDQLLARDQPITEEEKERCDSRCDFWWQCVALLAAIVAVIWASQIESFRMLSMLSAIATVVAFLWFLFGIKFYTCNEPIGSPLSDVVYVIYTAVTNRNVAYPQSPDQLYENYSGIVQISPHISWLRWLDRAAVLVSQDEEKAGNNICSVEQVKGVKLLLKMLPMWATFITFSLVSATGSTFFIEEATNIDEDFLILLFILLQRLTKFLVSESSDYIIENLEKKRIIRQKAMLVRIGIGMILCVICCIVAWKNAHHWLHLVNTYEEPAEYMSVFILIPQYIILGIMEGLSEGGLESFFDSQVSKSTAKYGPPFEECVEGIGKFVSVACILILTDWFKWFKDDINSSRLDNFYAFLAVLSSINVIIYWLVAHWYVDERFLEENDGIDMEMANSVQALQEDNLVLRTLSNKERYNSEEKHSQPLLKQNERDDRETEQLMKHDISDSKYQVPSDAQKLNGMRSFTRASPRGIYKRFYSMR